MKTLLLVLTVFTLSGCGLIAKKEQAPEPQKEKIIWKVPEFTMPDRPVMRSQTIPKTDGEVVRNVELDMDDVTTYAQQLENILLNIKNGSNSK